MEPQRISYMWLIRNDLFLLLVILGLFIYICRHLLITILIKKNGLLFKPRTYLDIFR